MKTRHSTRSLAIALVLTGLATPVAARAAPDDAAPAAVSRDALELVCADAAAQQAMAASRTAPAAERTAELDRRRGALRRALVATVLRESLEIELTLGPWLGLGATDAELPPVLPGECPALGGATAAWAALHRQAADLVALQEEMDVAATALFTGLDGGDGLYAQLVAAIHELALWEQLASLIQGDARRPAAFAPARIERLVATLHGAATGQDPGQDSGAAAGPEAVYTRFPLLRRPGSWLGPVPDDTAARALFDELHPDAPQEARAALGDAALERVHAHLDQLLAGSGAEPPGMSGAAAAASDAPATGAPAAVPAEPPVAGAAPAAAEPAGEVAAGAYEEAWRRFARHELDALLEASVAALLADPEAQELVREQVGSIAGAWREELRRLRASTCLQDAALLESEPQLLALHLQRHADEHALAHLDAFCHHPQWGRHARRSAESIGFVAGGLAFVGALLSAPLAPLAPLLYPAAALLTALAHLSTAGRVAWSAALDSSLFDPSPAQRRLAQGTIAINLGAAAFATGLSTHLRGLQAAGGLREAWRFFLPYHRWPVERSVMFTTIMGVETATRTRKFLDSGVNPLTELPFWMDLTATYLRSITLARVGDSRSLQQFGRELLISQGITLEVDLLAQQSRHILTGEAIDPRTLRFNLWWESSTGILNKGLFRGLRSAVDLVGSRFGPGTRFPLLVAYTALIRYVIGTFRSTAFVRYVYRHDLSYTDALATLRLGDLLPQGPDPYAPDRSLPPAQLQAMQRIVAALRTEDPALEALAEELLAGPSSAPETAASAGAQGADAPAAAPW
jgi:hypothetical protein